MLPRIQISVLALMLMAGCAGPGRKLTPLERQQQRDVQPAQVETPREPEQPKVEVKPEPKPVEPSPAPVVTPPVVAPAPAPIALTGWISLKEWCAQNKIEAPKLKITVTETN